MNSTTITAISSDTAAVGPQTTEIITSKTVTTKLQTLAELDHASLQREWRRLYRVPPPRRVSGDLLMLGIAWKLQAQVNGGLPATAKRRLAELTKSLQTDGDIARSRITRVKPGARIVREWGGKAHTVIVLEDGFEWREQRWRSLSVIAREITGVRWSGPRFFGLIDPPRQSAADTETTHG